MELCEKLVKAPLDKIVSVCPLSRLLHLGRHLVGLTLAAPFFCSRLSGRVISAPRRADNGRQGAGRGAQGVAVRAQPGHCLWGVPWSGARGAE